MSASDIRSSVGARRAWLRHCSALAVAAGLLAASPAHAQGASAAATRAGAPVLLVLGDSLSAEYGLARGRGWVALLEKRLAAEKLDWRVVNASISGETTSGGRSRLTALLKEHRPRVVVIELGGNDALRGLPLDMTRSNISDMARAAKAAGARVLIAGMAMPPNYGRAYGEAFTGLFATVAQAEKTALLPFFLAGVADGPKADELFQADRIHPKAEAHPQILANVWPVLRPLLK
jgi:acyl-CoA thioesterase-1